jgi:hypothetical protein
VAAMPIPNRVIRAVVDTGRYAFMKRAVNAVSGTSRRDTACSTISMRRFSTRAAQSAGRRPRSDSAEAGRRRASAQLSSAKDLALAVA